MKKSLLSLIVILFAVSVYAEDIYMADTAAGLADGSSCANAIADTSVTYGGGAGSVDAGDTLHVCGLFDWGANASPVITAGGSGTSGNVITIVFEDGAEIRADYFGVNSAIKIDGYDYITVDGGTNGKVWNDNNGGDLTYQFGSTGVPARLIYLNNADNITIKNLNLAATYDAKDDGTENTQAGSYDDRWMRAIDAANCDYLTIQDNTVTNSGWMLNFGGTSPTDLTIKGNTLSNFSAAIIVAVVTDYSNILIEDNTISDTSEWTYNDGIKMFSSPDSNTTTFTDLIIRNNYFEDCCLGSTHGSTAFILLDHGRYPNLLIYNNDFVGNVAGDCSNGWITLGAGRYESAPYDYNGKVLNNTFHKQFTGTDILMYFTYNVSGLDVYNNVLYSEGGTVYTITEANGATGTNNDYNNWYLVTGSQSGLTPGANSIAVDPGWNANRKPDSAEDPIVDSGTNTFNATVTTDKDGIARPQNVTTDMGAYEFDAGGGGDVTAPTMTSATIASNGTTLTLVYDESVTQGAGYNDSDLDVDCTGGTDIAVTYSSGNTTATHVYTLGSTVDVGWVCDIDFNGDANSLEDGSGNDLAAIVSGSVTNNSTQTPPSTANVLGVTLSGASKQ